MDKKTLFRYLTEIRFFCLILKYKTIGYLNVMI
ncbi:hypothetical protein RSC2_00842 [Bacillus paralicheniformis]|nr:hypothetical protein RSC1_03403 [Bacillus paralicheniformis]BCE09046.1 hypothetical protein RSC2_00842 [Bacillus paralicheniformis]BCE15180.1 hypothetical protein RSC3_02536 [Bacillus paralicheniformis]